MANYTMHHLNVGSDTYEMVDEQGRANIAPSFSTSTAYAAGDYVIYGGKLYQFTAAHTGAWTGADVEECTVAEKLGEGGSGDGLTEDIKQALLQIAEKVAYIDDQGATYYQALYDSFYPPAELDSISAVYTQSGTVYNTDTLDSLKPDLVVTAHYSDQTTETVTTYTLSGTLTEGTSTITVSYGGKTDTFDVTVTAMPVNPFDGVNWNDGTRITGSSEYTGQANYSTTDYVNVSDISSVTMTLTGSSGNVQYYIVWYTSNVNSSYISHENGYINYSSGSYPATVTSEKPNNALYCRICTTKASHSGTSGFPYALDILDIDVEFS